IEHDQVSAVFFGDDHFNRSIFPVQPVESRLDSSRFEHILPVADLCLDNIRGSAMDIDLQRLAIYGRTIHHEVINALRRPCTFHGLSSGFVLPAGIAEVPSVWKSAAAMTAMSRSTPENL